MLNVKSKRSRAFGLASVITATIGSVIWIGVGISNFGYFPTGLFPWIVFPVMIAFLGFLGLRTANGRILDIPPLGAAVILLFYAIIGLASFGMLYLPAAVLMMIAAISDSIGAKSNKPNVS
jgi:hypothetical protein